MEKDSGQNKKQGKNKKPGIHSTIHNVYSVYYYTPVFRWRAIHGFWKKFPI
jgi:hypothetical protein